MRKIAVVFPGVGYTYDRPLLYYAGAGSGGWNEGIGHCALGYAAEPPQNAAPRKDDYVYFI